MSNRVLLLLVLLFAPLMYAAPAAADAPLGPYYCGDCSFGGNGTPYTPEVSTFIRTTVNPDLGEGGWRDGDDLLAVVICNGSTCATYQYMANGTHLQDGDEVPDENSKEDYENSEDAPADPSPGTGGGGSSGGFQSGGGIDWWSVCQTVLCVDGRNRSGTVTVGEVENP